MLGSRGISGAAAQRIVALAAGAALLAFLVALLAPGEGDARRAKTCQGKRANIVAGGGNNHVRGTYRNDVVVLGGGNDTFTDRTKTNDIVCGGPGNDKIDGGAGNDELYGQGGSDTIRDGRTPGNDFLDGAGGNDKLYGSTGYETMLGGPGNDTLLGGVANDFMKGGGGRDRVNGQGGNDRVLGQGGADNVTGANGNDNVSSGGGNDTVSGGTGDDRNKYKGGRVGWPAKPFGKAGVDGGGGDDFVIGDTGEDTLNAGAGNDVLRGDQGTDELNGGGGRDIASFTTASAISNLGSASPGCSNTRGFAAVILLNQNIACEFIDATSLVKNPLSSIEEAVGSSYADHIEGDNGNNRLDGGAGDDEIDGNGGNDTAFGGPGFDRCDAETRNSCPGSGSSTRQITAELTRSIDGSATLAVIGSAGGDTILVRSIPGGYYIEADNSGPSSETDSCEWIRAKPTGLSCKGSIDSLLVDGADGGDNLTIGSIPGSVHVTVNGGDGSDNINGGPGNDRLLSGDSGNDNVSGGGGQDLLYSGGSDPDKLFGGAARDQATIAATCQGGNFFDGGPGRDNVSYAFSRHGLVWRMTPNAGGFTRRGCGSDTYQAVSNIEGTRGVDILLGDGNKNGLIGHEGADTMRAGGGRDYVDARDGGRDKVVNCGGGRDTFLGDKQDRPQQC